MDWTRKVNPVRVDTDKGSTLTLRKPSRLLDEAAFKVLAYLLRR